MAFRVQRIADALSDIMKDYSFTEEQALEVYNLGDSDRQTAKIGGFEFSSSMDHKSYEYDEYYIDVYGPKGLACTRYHYDG